MQGATQPAAEQPVAAPPRLNSSSWTFSQQVTGREQLMDPFELHLNLSEQSSPRFNRYVNPCSLQQCDDLC